MPVLGKIYWTAACASTRTARLRERLESHGVVLGAPANNNMVEGGGREKQAWLDEAKLVVAEASGAGADVGAEVFYALHKLRVPTLVLAERGQHATSGMLANPHPLLTTVVYDKEEEAVAALDEFVSPTATPGRIFVVEGGDGAGKQTQSAMLRARLQAEGYPVATMDFPHDAAMHGKLIRELLSGSKGDITQVNPLLFASLYAQNRFDVGPILRCWLRRGCNVVLDRYMEANFGHQASKLPPDERPKLIDALSKFEHDWLDLPRAHRVVYLDLPPDVALRAMASDASRANLDIHETAGSEYKNAVRDTFIWCAEHFDHWLRVPCVDGAGARISKQRLADNLHAELQSEFVNRGKAPVK